MSAWDNSSSIVLHPESGNCGPFSNTEMLVLLSTAYQSWTDFDEVDLTISSLTGQLTDIGSDNYQTYLVTGLAADNDEDNASDGFSPIAFDDDGEIIDALYGEDAKYSVLGFSAITDFESSILLETITEAQLLLNCRCIDDHPIYNESNCVVGGVSTIQDEDVFKATIVHELGHLLNLDHSIANEDSYDSTSADDNDEIPIMYPLAFETTTPFDITEDDKVAIASIYPSTNLDANYCLVTGTLLDEDGDELRCANVEALSTDADNDNTVSFVTGALAPANFEVSGGIISLSDTCTSNCGAFQLYLQPSLAYTLNVTQIDATFTGGTGVGPCSTQDSSIVEEEIASISTSQCTAGSTIALGNITTTSGSTSSSGSSGGGSGSGSADSSVGYRCTLSPDAPPHTMWWFGAAFLTLFFWRHLLASAE